MYTYIGNDYALNNSEIIGIFDTDTSTVAKATREFLAAAEKNGSIINTTYDIPRSFIVCSDGRVYMAQPSPATLTKRAGTPVNINDKNK